MKNVVSAKHALLSAWKIASSTSEPWTSSIDSVVKKVVDNMVKLLAVILDCPPVTDTLDKHQHTGHSSVPVQTASLYQVMVI